MNRYRAKAKANLPLSKIVTPFLLISGWAAADPVITDMVLTEQEVIISFTDSSINNRFEVGRNEDLDPLNWVPDQNGTYTNLGNNNHRYTLPRTSADREFYRVIGSFLGTGADPDGDGLATALENQTDPNTVFFSDPTKFDTDGDGFSDGVEFLANTEPNNPNSVPDLVGLPTVEFAEDDSMYEEGQGVVQLALVNPGGFTGSIRYTVQAVGSDSPPAEFQVSATSGGISFSVVDDAIVEQEVRMYLIKLTKVPATFGYNPSGGVSHVVAVTDNDGYWSGSLTETVESTGGGLATRSEKNFRVCIARSPGGVDIQFRSGSSDGFLQPDGGASSQSTGVIPDTDIAGEPQEIFPSEANIFTSSQFEARTPPLPVKAGGFLAGMKLQRQISLSGSEVGDNQITGTFIDQVTHVPSESGPERSFMNTTTTGVFILLRDIPQPSVFSSSLTPN